MKPNRSFQIFALVTGASLLAACGKTDEPAAAGGAERSTATVVQAMEDFGVDWSQLGPVEALEAMAASMANQRMDEMWDLLPQSYRDEMNDLVRQFADKLDPEVYEQWTSMMAKAVDVLSEKRSMLTSPTFTMGMNIPDADQFADGIEGMIDAMDIILDSEVGSLDSLRQMDIGKFLSQTGPRLRDLNPNQRDRNPLRGLEDATFELLSSDDRSARVQVSGAPGGRDRELELVKVEDRWMPVEVVENWDRGIGQARQAIERIDLDRYRMTALTAISAMDGTLDAIAEAEDEVELGEILRMGGRLGGLGRER